MTRNITIKIQLKFYGISGSQSNAPEYVAGWSICSSQVEVYSEEGPRTNNNLEGWHSKVKKIAGKNHLNIFEIVELFKKEQASTEIEIRQLMTGTRRKQAPHRSKKYFRITKPFVDNFDYYTLSNSS